MDLVQVRKIATFVEEVAHEGGPPVDPPVKRGATIAVIKNPYAGRYVEDIMPLMEALDPLGLDMAERLVQALGGAEAIDSYGKGAIVGVNGETEHAAVWHVPGGLAMRKALGGAKAIVPSSKKVGSVGTRLDVPMTHINASYVRSHFDAMEVSLYDSPRPDEILLALVMATEGRVHARVGGLHKNDIKGDDGLR